MITDYAQVMATLQLRSVRLNDACAQKKWGLVCYLAMDIGKDMVGLAMLAMTKQSEIIDKESENEG